MTTNLDISQILEAHIKALEENTRALNEYNMLVKYSKKKWLLPDEAANELGLRITKSGSHLRKLQFLREKGFLTKHGQKRPYTYLRQEIDEVAEKIKLGTIFIG